MHITTLHSPNPQSFSASNHLRPCSGKVGEVAVGTSHKLSVKHFRHYMCVLDSDDI